MLVQILVTFLSILSVSPMGIFGNETLCSDFIDHLPDYTCEDQIPFFYSLTRALFYIYKGQKRYVLKVNLKIFSKGIEYNTYKRVKYCKYVVPTYELLEIDRAYLIVMDKIEDPLLGYSIFHNKKFRRISFIMQLFLKIIESLECINKSNLIHGNLNRANIYVTRDGSPIITDFNIMRPKDQLSEPQGKLNYLSPEVIYGMENDQLVEYTDKIQVFSLGILMYYSIYKHHPLVKKMSSIDINNAYVSFQKNSRTSIAEMLRQSLCLEEQRFSMEDLKLKILEILKEQKPDLLVRDYVFRIGGFVIWSMPPRPTNYFLKYVLPVFFLLFIVIGFFVFYYIVQKQNKSQHLIEAVVDN